MLWRWILDWCLAEPRSAAMLVALFGALSHLSLGVVQGFTRGSSRRALLWSWAATMPLTCFAVDLVPSLATKPRPVLSWSGVLVIAVPFMLGAVLKSFSVRAAFGGRRWAYVVVRTFHVVAWTLSFVFAMVEAARI